MTNELADAVYTALTGLHSRVYRNDAPKSPTFPYVVYRVSNGFDSYPTSDYRVDVKIYEKNDGTVSMRTIEALGDSIDTALNTKVIGTTTRYHFTKDLRQFDDDPMLEGVAYVNLQYTVRVY